MAQFLRIVVPALLLTVYPLVNASWNHPPPAVASQDVDVYQRRQDPGKTRLLHAVTELSSIGARGVGFAPRHESIYHYIDSQCS